MDCSKFLFSVFVCNSEERAKLEKLQELLKVTNI